MGKPSTALAKNEDKQIIAADALPDADIAALLDGGITGLENVTSRDLLIPRITILQSLSPQLNPAKPDFIKGARVGQFCDVGLGEVWDSLMIIPCYYANILLEWAPRASGKGLVKNHGTNRAILAECRKDEKNRPFTKEGNLIAETAEFFCLNLTAGNRRSFIPLSSTQLKPGKGWLTKITDVRRNGRAMPLFFQAWHATARPTSNNQGDWLLWHFEAGPEILQLDPTKRLLEEAKEFAKDAASGLVQGDVTGRDEEPAAEAEDAPF